MSIDVQKVRKERPCRVPGHLPLMNKENEVQRVMGRGMALLGLELTPLNLSPELKSQASHMHHIAGQREKETY